MTKEKKLLKLLEIAISNGWYEENLYTGLLQFKDIVKHYSNDFDIMSDNISVSNGQSYDGEQANSLNSLVCDWKQDKTSFIEALCKACPNIEEDYNINTHTPFHIGLICLWVKLPSSQRLEWLFETFNQLL